MDITINLSKPEKDPRDIAKAGKAKNRGIRVVCYAKKMKVTPTYFSSGKTKSQNYSDYIVWRTVQFTVFAVVYYNEHCIVFNDRHIPMKIDKAVFAKLLDFVRQFHIIRQDRMQISR